MELPNCSLNFREGSSDKTYEIRIEPSGNGFVVNFAFGRRGSALKAGTKTNTPVSYETAQKIYDALVLEKTRKGYSPGESGVAFAGTELAGRASGVTCLLLSTAPLPIEEYIGNPQWVGLEKFDGDRRLIKIDPRAREVVGINRKGLIVPLPEPIVAEALRIAPNFAIDTPFVLDGELLGNELVVFDVAAGKTRGGEEICALSFSERFGMLEQAITPDGSHPIRRATAYNDVEGKAGLVDSVRRQNGEGVVFKKANSTYRGGRTDEALKVKFIETASIIVGPANGAKRSVAMFVLDSGGERIGCGNVTIPANFQIPTEGEIAEVSYLYAYRESGSLYQPVYKGARTDISADECLQSQFKFRASAP